MACSKIRSFLMNCCFRWVISEPHAKVNFALDVRRDLAAKGVYKSRLTAIGTPALHVVANNRFGTWRAYRLNFAMKTKIW